MSNATPTWRTDISSQRSPAGYPNWKPPSEARRPLSKARETRARPWSEGTGDFKGSKKPWLKRIFGGTVWASRFLWDQRTWQRSARMT